MCPWYSFINKGFRSIGVQWLYKYPSAISSPPKGSGSWGAIDVIFQVGNFLINSFIKTGQKWKSNKYSLRFLAARRVVFIDTINVHIK